LNPVRRGSWRAGSVVAPVGAYVDAALLGAFVGRPVLALHLALIVVILWGAAARCPGTGWWRRARARHAGAHAHARATFIAAGLCRDLLALQRFAPLPRHAAANEVLGLGTLGHDALQHVPPAEGVNGDAHAARVDPEELIVVTRVRPEARPSAACNVRRERPDPDALDDDLIGRPGSQVPHDHNERAVESPPDTAHDRDRAREGLRPGRRDVGHQRVRRLPFLLRGPRPVAGEVGRRRARRSATGENNEPDDGPQRGRGQNASRSSLPHEPVLPPVSRLDPSATLTNN